MTNYIILISTFNINTVHRKYYTKFKEQLDALKVNYTVCETYIKDSNDRRSKIGIVHENVLLNLEEPEIDHILSV